MIWFYISLFTFHENNFSLTNYLKNKTKYILHQNILYQYSFIPSHVCLLLIASNYICQLLARKLIYTWGTLNNDSGRLQIYEAQQF